MWREKLKRRRLNKKKADMRRIDLERRRENRRKEELRQKERDDVDVEDGSDGWWGIDILGFLWPKQNSEEKKSTQRRLEVEERADIASDRIFVSDDETYEFYGFNTTYLDKG